MIFSISAADGTSEEVPREEVCGRTQEITDMLLLCTYEKDGDLRRKMREKALDRYFMEKGVNFTSEYGSKNVAEMAYFARYMVERSSELN